MAHEKRKLNPRGKDVHFKGQSADCFYTLFNSMISLAKAAEEATSEESSRCKRDKSTYDLKWKGGYTWEAWQEALAHGDPKLTDPVKNRVSRIGSILAARTESQSVDWTHQRARILDKSRYMQGRPDCLMKPIMIAGGSQKSCVKVLINVTASGIVSAETIQARNSAIIAALQALTLRTRMQTEVDFFFGSRPMGGWYGGSNKGCNSREVYHVVRAKRRNEPFNLAEIALATSAALLRHTLFATVSDEWEPEGWTTYTEQPCEAPQVIMDEYDWYIPMMHGNDRMWLSETATIEWISKALKKFGIEIK